MCRLACEDLGMSLKTPFSADINKYWKVTTTKKVGSYGQTQLIGVVADSVDDVTRKVFNAHPDASITAITHIGAVDVE